MSCNSCLPPNPCGCKKKKNCDDCPILDWVPNTACTISLTTGKCTDTLELRPGIQACETKTHYGQNPVTGCLEYQNELYVATNGQEGYIESVCPSDIAKYIKLEELENVEDKDPEQCSLLVYHADDDCGEGCEGIENSWIHWYANEHLADHLNMVAGFNSEGCLEALTPPSDTSEYWFAMWRGDGEFGYTQPEPVEELPRDANGDPIVLSQDENGKPIVGTIPLNCFMTNIMSNLGSDIWGSFRIIQSTPDFSSDFNNHDGNFVITWNDWNYNQGQIIGHAGTGRVYGKMDFSFVFDTHTGAITYRITNLHFDKVVWTKDNGFLLGEQPTLTLKGVQLGVGTEVLLCTHTYDGFSSWTQNINRDVPCSLTVNVGPGETFGPYDYAYAHMDWVYDDEGYTQVNFSNKLDGWTNC